MGLGERRAGGRGGGRGGGGVETGNTVCVWKSDRFRPHRAHVNELLLLLLLLLLSPPLLLPLPLPFLLTLLLLPLDAQDRVLGIEGFKRYNRAEIAALVEVQHELSSEDVTNLPLVSPIRPLNAILPRFLSIYFISI